MPLTSLGNAFQSIQHTFTTGVDALKTTARSAAGQGLTIATKAMGTLTKLSENAVKTKAFPLMQNLAAKFGVDIQPSPQKTVQSNLPAASSANPASSSIPSQKTAGPKPPTMEQIKGELEYHGADIQLSSDIISNFY